MALKIPCPHCGPREYTEFTFGGELRPLEGTTSASDFARVYLRENLPQAQDERWFHLFGCRRWVTLRRDTLTNAFDEAP